MSAVIHHHPSSFRDPSGYIFEKDGVIYRQVNKIFQPDFDFFVSGGCYDDLVTKGLLLPHETIRENLTGDTEWYQTLKPEKLTVISYPWEWSFGMLRDAALLTLRLLKEGLEWGMILKDATPYNIQWHKGKLVFIDSLSFEKYDETKPWIAYRQFCEHFLGPLLLAHYAKHPLPELMLAYPDGIPVSVTSSLLPRKTRFSIHTYLHIHLQAKYSHHAATEKNKTIVFSKKKLINIINSLEILVNKTRIPAQTTAWSDYYDEATQRPDYYKPKQEIISSWLQKTQPARTIDFGANTGEFSALAANYGLVIASDFDPFCVDRLYQKLKQTNQEKICPLILDLSRPSPGIGVNNNERSSFTERMQADMGMALALIHHLSIGKNIPFNLVAQFFHLTCKNLIIEFVPKEDEKIKLMLQHKKDIYAAYNESKFLHAFEQYFEWDDQAKVGNSGRTLYLMKRHER